MGCNSCKCMLTKSSSTPFCGHDIFLLTGKRPARCESSLQNEYLIGPAIGYGGFGVVHEIAIKSKHGGKACIKHCALKSISKMALLDRSTGIANLKMELAALGILGARESIGNRCNNGRICANNGRTFICHLQESFQDSVYVYLVLDLASNGGMGSLELSKILSL